MSSDNEHKVGRTLDKLAMGIIIGGAIGSVLGLLFAPKKGKDTRKMLKEKGEELLEKGKEVKDAFVEDHGDQLRQAANTVKEKSKGFVETMKEKLAADKKIPSEK